jgi:hypothetical protein
MKIIAHRGLTNGPNKHLENRPLEIQSCLTKGFDCEIDLWVFEDRLYLGHDGPQYNITKQFLKQQGLWIHCKNLSALEYCQQDTELNYFWHDTDTYTLTSKGYIWTYPDKEVSKLGIMVLPEWSDPTLNNALNSDCYAVCTDFADQLNKLKGS